MRIVVEEKTLQDFETEICSVRGFVHEFTKPKYHRLFQENTFHSLSQVSAVELNG